MSRPRLTIIDYGMGNLWSVHSALRYLGCDAQVSADPAEVRRADTLLLPGVGSFRKAMNTLRHAGLDEAILEAVRVKGSKMLGICLGMQLLGVRGSEDGDTAGLGLLPVTVDRFTTQEIGARKLPHIGFDAVRCATGSRLLRGLPQSADFYFVHSYRMLPEIARGQSSTCEYGVDFMAAYEHENVYATQFHPEKSQTNGLMLLRNYLAA
jgi:glutamine amidotransferase